MKKISLLLGLCSLASYSFAAGGSFTIFPTQVVFENPGKVKDITLVNLSDSLLNTQSTLKTYQQKLVNGRLIESNALISGSPAVIATPIVMQNIAPNSKQSIRLLAIRQNPESEIVYRYYVKNLNPRSVDSSGTQFEIEYGMPVFILPQHVNESYNITYVKLNGKPYLKTTNIGNVHVMLKEVYIQSAGKPVAIGTIGRLLAGESMYLSIPSTLDKNLHSQINLNVAKAGLINFEQESQVALTITK